MISKFIYSGIPRKILASLEGDTVLIKVVAAEFAIGKTLRAHLIMDRGLSGEVPVYWVNENLEHFRKSLGVRAYVQNHESI